MLATVLEAKETHTCVRVCARTRVWVGEGEGARVTGRQ
jgi:hypothetical protein